MERVTIFLRTTKTEGDIKLRFRLRDGREVDLYHKSEIRAALKDMAKFDENGNVKPKVSVFNKELKLAIDHEIDAILLSSNYILHCSIYKKDIERLNQKVKKNK